MQPTGSTHSETTQSSVQLHLTENQDKVIRDKYLKDAKSPEEWLQKVARNIALGDLLYDPRLRPAILEGVSHHIVGKDAGEGETDELLLLHHGHHSYKERVSNFKRFMSNLYKVADEDPAAKEMVAAAQAKFYALMAGFRFLPNSPTLMNAGRELQQLSACYVLPVPDSIEGIFGAVKNQALIHKSGGGTGFSFGRIRPANDAVLSTQGIASGPISFMKIFDAATEQVKQGGTRRGANMAILPYWHPDIIDFITMKRARNNTTLENFNISVGVDARFMDAVKNGGDIELLSPRTKEVVRTMPAREIFDLMTDCAWECGDPGYVVLDRINNSSSNPTPALGEIEATNPCFRGDMRLATDKGLLTFEELHEAQTHIGVATDDRVSPIREMESLSGTVVCEEPQGGVTVRPAVPVFRTRTNWPLMKLVTRHGFEVVATPDHEFFTPTGRKAIKDLKPGDEILIQSGAGVWNKDDRLPPFEPTDKLAARARRGEAKLPRRWSRELGELLGWIVGDGWVSAETPKGRKVPNYTVGLSFGSEEERALAARFHALIQGWTGLSGSKIQRPTGFYLYYKSGLYYFLRSLGLSEKQSLEKVVPDSIWKAPREAVLGFLSGLFSADGTVARFRRTACSVRLAGSSKRLLQQVQQLLLNEGIVAKLHLRRAPARKLLPDANRRPREYQCAAQYELILDKENRDRFVREVGFILASKQEKASSWIGGMSRRTREERFTQHVVSVESAGTADVFCTTESETNSIIANGFVVANCGEQPLLPNEPCNLGSINLYKFVTGYNGGSNIDWKRLRDTVFSCIHFLDNVIDLNHHPVPEIELMAKGNRRIGLGVMGWGETLVALDIPYDSERAIEKAEEVMGFINETALEASVEIAGRRGVFPNWKDSVYDPEGKHFRGQHIRPRNCARTTIAPTGTIAIAAGLQGSGIEPFFAIAYTRYNARGIDALKAGKKPDEAHTFFEINPHFKAIAEANDYFGLDEEELWKKIDENHKSVRGISEIPKHIQEVFATAHDVSFEHHIAVQGAFQKFTDNAVSKTINCSNETTREEIARAYMLGYDLGVKGLTVYRDGSKTQQVLNIETTQTEAAETAPAITRRPSAVHGVTSEYYEKETGYGPLHVNIIYDEQGPFRVFANIPPLGTEIAGLTAVIGILLSKYLEAGGKTERILKHLNSVKGDIPIGFGPNRVESIPHAISQILRDHLIKHGHMQANGKGAPVAGKKPEARVAPVAAVTCPQCYSTNVEFVNGCKEPTCFDCGFSNCS